MIDLADLKQVLVRPATSPADRSTLDLNTRVGWYGAPARPR